MQCIARLVSRLPVTLLEVVTLSHCLCALGMYVLWWSKPLDISEPIVLDHPHIREMAAFMIQINPKRSEFPRPPGLPQDILIRNSIEEVTDACQKLAVGATGHFSLSLYNDNPGNFKNIYRIILRSKNCTNDQLKSILAILIVEPRPHSDPRISEAERYSFWPPTEASFVLRWLAFTVMTAAYGGLHCAVWFSLFPTATETLLWRLSSVCVASGGLMLGGLGKFNDLISLTGDSRKPSRRLVFLKIFCGGRLWSLISFVVYCLMMGFMITYLASRGFLVIEAFISLRHQPITAYETPEWTQWIPHL